MRLYIDTAHVEEIRTANQWGVIHGVTTNPSLMAKEGRDWRVVLQEITAIVDGPISAEVIAQDTAGMLREAETLAAVHPNIVVKIPVTAPGLEAVHQLRQRGIKTNVTLVFSVNQALLAARAGANYVSVFVGRLDDAGHDGMDVIADTARLFALHGLDAEVIAASIRHPLHVTQAALAGAEIATVPFPVLKLMLKHPLTDAGVERFMADWTKLQQEVD